MSRNIVFEGWLTKSPPTKRIWRTKWRRRWFALRQSGELPGQYFLDYYADRNCRRLKGTINLDLCEQVDAGLHMERSGNGTLDPKLRGSVFTIQTQSRTYHLEADCEAEMEQWVDAICRVCGLRATDDSVNVLVTYQNNSSISATNKHYERADTNDPYIPISECITGVRAQDGDNPFPFEQRSVSEGRNPISLNQAQTRLNPEFSENESNISDDECKSLNASQSNIQVWSVAKSFTKLAVNSKRNGVSENGPPVPPRPPKTFAMSKEMLQKESCHGTKIMEQAEVHVENFYSSHLNPWLRIPRCASKSGSPSSPCRLRRSRQIDDDGHFHGNLSMQYCNLPTLPPAVDRALKPRHSSHSVGHIHQLTAQTGLHFSHNEEVKAEVLQYLDLDLHPSKPMHTKSTEAHRKKLDVMHGKSLSVVDTDSAYKTVDFLKTEAFNITRQDAEASRSYHH